MHDQLAGLTRLEHCTIDLREIVHVEWSTHGRQDQMVVTLRGGGVVALSPTDSARLLELLPGPNHAPGA